MGEWARARASVKGFVRWALQFYFWCIGTAAQLVNQIALQSAGQSDVIKLGSQPASRLTDWPNPIGSWPVSQSAGLDLDSPELSSSKRYFCTVCTMSNWGREISLSRSTAVSLRAQR